MLRLTGGALLAAYAWPRAWGAPEPAAQEFSFFAINDLHFTDAHCAPFFERVIKQLKSEPGTYDFCLLVGDLSEDGRADQLAPVREIFDTLGVPVYNVIGNHDHLADTDCQLYLELITRRLNYTFEHKGWQVVVADLAEGRKAQVRASPHTLDFLETSAAAIPANRPVILATHFPLGPSVPMRVTNADDVLGLWKGRDLTAVINGHFHGFTERQLGATVLTTDRCCSFRRNNHDGTKEKGYFVCRAKDGQVTRTFVEVPMGAEVAATAPAPR
jgi:UDP-2,3-diacylglucosamine pyrophosphatase LpxH